MTKEEIIANFIRESDSINAEISYRKTEFFREMEIINTSKKTYSIDEDVDRLPGSRKDAYIIETVDELRELFIRNTIFTLQAINYTNYSEFKKNPANIQQFFLLNKLMVECKEVELEELLALQIKTAKESLKMLDLYLEFLKKLI